MVSCSDKGRVPRLGTGWRSCVQTPVVGDLEEYCRPESDRSVSARPVQTGRALEPHGNFPGRIENTSRKHVQSGRL